MKTIGLIGGMSWESTKVYYELINRKVQELLGGFHSAKIVLYSFDFAEIEKLQHQGKWPELCQLMSDAAQKLEKAGTEIILLCTNTMHLCSDSITQNISVLFLHIAEATGEEISSRKIKKVGLLGTRFTMEKDFYKTVLNQKFGVKVIIPAEAERKLVHRIIYEELVHGKIKSESREKIKSIIAHLQEKGAEGVILGCTEISLLISEKDADIPVLDTTKIHAEKAAERAVNTEIQQS
ncbi:MAG: aspartate/glutamate racemase family protein [Tangfeifania sp.]